MPLPNGKARHRATKNRLKSADYSGGADGTQTHDLYDAKAKN